MLTRATWDIRQQWKLYMKPCNKMQISLWVSICRYQTSYLSYKKYQWMYCKIRQCHINWFLRADRLPEAADRSDKWSYNCLWWPHIQLRGVDVPNCRNVLFHLPAARCKRIEINSIRKWKIGAFRLAHDFVINYVAWFCFNMMHNVCVLLHNEKS